MPQKVHTMHGRDHLATGADPIPGIGEPGFDPFYDAIAEIAATRDLRGYWRLGEGGLGPYADTSGYPGPTPAMVRQVSGTAMTDLATGALPASDDDGAVQFNNSTGAASDWLACESVGTEAANYLEQDLGTIMGWVKPFASGSSFKGGIVSCFGEGAGFSAGWSLGVEWPTRRVFHLRGNSTFLYGPILDADEWVFVTGAKDATSTRIYLNGALVATGPPITGDATFNITPKIGKWNHAYAQVLYGAVDEVSVWGGTLTDDEIALLAGSGGLAGDTTVSSVINTVGAYTPQPGETVFANGTFTVTLPTAVGNLGGEITIKNTGAGTITVGRTGSQTIDGSASDGSLTGQQARTYVSDGTGWQQTGTYP